MLRVRTEPLFETPGYLVNTGLAVLQFSDSVKSKPRCSDVMSLVSRVFGTPWQRQQQQATRCTAHHGRVSGSKDRLPPACRVAVLVPSAQHHHASLVPRRKPISHGEHSSIRIQDSLVLCLRELSSCRSPQSGEETLNRLATIQACQVSTSTPANRVIEATGK